ncbi:hypothetical protein KXV81_008914 [Aspergillus fumigatus]|nr:hypothetical protein KXV81_008914 [Aspergillus fumigatus]
MASDLTLVLSEEQAWLGQARPEEALPICIAFAHGDQDNPPKWDKLQQWYITFFVSVLNALTWWCAEGILSAATGIAEDSMSPSKSPRFASRLLGPTTRLRRLVVPPLHLQLPLALAPNIGTIILCRFLAGRAGVDGAVGGKGGRGALKSILVRYQTYSALALAGAPPVREPDVAAAGLRVGVGSTVLLHGMSDAAAESAGS